MTKIKIDTENQIFEKDGQSFASGCIGYKIQQEAGCVPIVTLTFRAEVDFTGDSDIVNVDT